MIISLEGAPEKVSGDFNCSYNRLTSLMGAPKKVGGDFSCVGNPLKSHDHAPDEVCGRSMYESAGDKVSLSVSRINGWIIGTANVGKTSWEVQLKRYDDPSRFGIEGGRISKMWLRRIGKDEPSLNYDRGWDRGKSPNGKGDVVNAIYRELVSKFN